MDLKDVIIQDCKLWEQQNNKDKMIPDYLGLFKPSESEENGMYFLEYNGSELWYGTLHEICAVVKSMLRKMDIDERIEGE